MPARFVAYAAGRSFAVSPFPSVPAGHWACFTRDASVDVGRFPGVSTGASSWSKKAVFGRTWLKCRRLKTPTNTWKIRVNPAFRHHRRSDF